VPLLILALGCADTGTNPVDTGRDTADSVDAIHAVADGVSKPDTPSSPDAGTAPDAAAPDQGAASHTLNVVFIGNSLTYGNDLPGVLAKVAASATPSWTISAPANHLPGGSSLRSAWRSAKALDLVRNTKPDVVVLQDQSSGPDLGRYPELWHGWVRAYGARSVFFMTWGKGDFGGKLFKQTADKLQSAYLKAAAPLGATVAPVGTAWKQHYAKSSLKLHSGDGLHPSPHGTYLAALVFFATLTGQAPTGLSTGGLNISAADAAALQKTALHAYEQTPLAVLAKQPLSAPADDHANTAAGATKLVFGQKLTARLGVADADFFAFAMTDSGRLDMLVQNPNHNKLIDLMIMDSSQKILGRNQFPSTALKGVDPFFTDLGESPILPAGNYYLRVGGTAPANKRITGRYAIVTK